MATETDPAAVARKLGLHADELRAIYDPEGRPMEAAFRVARRHKLDPFQPLGMQLHDAGALDEDEALWLDGIATA